MGGVSARWTAQKPYLKRRLGFTSKDSEVNVDMQTLKLNEMFKYARIMLL